MPSSSMRSVGGCCNPMCKCHGGIGTARGDSWHENADRETQILARRTRHLDTGGDGARRTFVGGECYCSGSYRLEISQSKISCRRKVNFRPPGLR